MTTTKGRCQCGAIDYEFEGAPRWVMHCHCENCRRAVSSAVATYLGVRLEQFRYLKGEPTPLRVLARREALLLRHLRLTDGLYGRAVAGRGASVPRHAHTIPSQWPPTAHGYVAEQLPWFEVSDHLPRYAADRRKRRGAGAEGAARRVIGDLRVLRWRRRSPISLTRQKSDKEIDMLRTLGLGFAFSVGAPAAVLAHHGWGSYDASKTVIVEGPIETSEIRESARDHHREGGGQDVDGDAGADLAHAEPRRAGRAGGGRQDGVGLRLRFHGSRQDEMRAERITVDGKTVEMRSDADAESGADAARAPLVLALEQSGFASAIRQSTWAYPTANVGHILALTLFAAPSPSWTCACSAPSRRAAGAMVRPARRVADARRCC